VCQISSAFFSLLTENSQCLLTLADFVEALSASGTTEYESIPEIFLNASESIDYLAENKVEVMKQLREQEKSLNSLFKQLHLDWEADTFIDRVETTIDYAKTFKDNQGKQMLNSALFDAALMTGLTDWVPKEALPKTGQKRPKELYPPPSLVTLK
jgi:hypothetical protein